MPVWLVQTLISCKYTVTTTTFYCLPRPWSRWYTSWTKHKAIREKWTKKHTRYPENKQYKQNFVTITIFPYFQQLHSTTISGSSSINCSNGVLPLHLVNHINASPLVQVHLEDAANHRLISMQAHSIITITSNAFAPSTISFCLSIDGKVLVSSTTA